MLIRSSPFARACLAMTMCAASASAQATSPGSPWTVTVSATMNPPIGMCAAVSLTIFDPAVKDIPRKPNGWRVSMADFDMTVTTPDGKSAVGQYNTASSFAVCGCQGAAVGTVATITATYPAQNVAPALRVPGVAQQATSTVALTPAKGTSNPLECAAAAKQTLAVAGTAMASPMTLQPAPSGAIGTALTTTGSLSRGGSVNTPVTAAPNGSRGLQQPAVGAPPTGVSVSGTPMVAHLSWNATPAAQRYAVWRGESGKVSVQRTPVPFTVTALDDTVADPRVTYQYTVIAHYANGSSGDAPAIAFISPPMVNPSGFTAAHAGNGKVNLQWQPVAGALRYRVDGTGLPNTGLANTATSATVNLVPSGPGSWKVTALYPGNFADYTTGAVATAMVRALPAHSQPWLTKNNGAGSASLAAAHYAQLCPGGQPACLVSLESTVLPGNRTPATMPFWGDAEGLRIAEEAVYGNVQDLGFGRRTNCTQRPTPTASLVTMCYTTSHGPGPGESGFADPLTITRAAAGEAAPGAYVDPLAYNTKAFLSKNPWGEMTRSGTVIIKDGAGAFSFYAFTPGLWDLRPFDRSWTWNEWEQVPSPLTSLVLDSEGPKALPHSCISCHGGHWDPATKRVVGASFLPLDPGVLAFGVTQPGDRTRYERAGQEEQIRRINQVVARSAPGSAVANYINGLYNGAVGSNGAVARNNYVPAGWAAQSGLYLSVVKPYCVNCHLAAPSAVNFASWGNFLQNKAAIYNAVCVAHTMPNAEIAFREFWTKDTGPLFLPGLLAASLGYSSCP